MFCLIFKPNTPAQNLWCFGVCLLKENMETFVHQWGMLKKRTTQSKLEAMFVNLQLLLFAVFYGTRFPSFIEKCPEMSEKCFEIRQDVRQCPSATARRPPFA